MHCLIDAAGVGTGSHGIVLQHLLEGWRAAFPDDVLTVAVDEEPGFDLPSGVRVERARADTGVRRLWARTGGVRRTARRVGADAVLSGIPATALLGTHCPRATIVHDVRHELRPHQFPRSRRLARAVTWGLTFRFADVLLCVSDRTRSDVVARHPQAAARAVRMPLGADHVDSWPRVEPASRYVLAFGHFANKNADKVVAGWARFGPEHPDLTLQLVAVPASERASLQPSATSRIVVRPWLDDRAFERLFAGAELVVFPSDFEGFGLPAIEAMRLGRRLVISADPALIEITGGHAVVADDLSPGGLAAAMTAALERTDEELAVARRHTDAFTWRRAAGIARAELVARVERSGRVLRS